MGAGAVWAMMAFPFGRVSARVVAYNSTGFLFEPAEEVLGLGPGHGLGEPRADRCEHADELRLAGPGRRACRCPSSASRMRPRALTAADTALSRETPSVIASPRHLVAHFDTAVERALDRAERHGKRRPIAVVGLGFEAIEPRGAAGEDLGVVEKRPDAISRGLHEGGAVDVHGRSRLRGGRCRSRIIPSYQRPATSDHRLVARSW